MYLPLANILHHKLGSLLNAFGIGIGVCMLITLTGLSRGSLYEVANRMESIDADLVVIPKGLSNKAITLSGIAISCKVAPIVKKEFPKIVNHAAPVSICTLCLAGQDQRVTRPNPDDWNLITKNAKIEGRIFDPKNIFTRWIDKKLLAPVEDFDEDENDQAPLIDLTNKLKSKNHNGLELVIDSRLAKAGKYKIGDKILAANQTWTIVGIVKAGVTTRVFMPIRTAQYLFGMGDITKCTMVFIKLKPGVNPTVASRKLAKRLGLDVVPISVFRSELMRKFSIMFTYVDAVNIIALAIAFLFVMITLYTMVIQRTREIAILKSCGASNCFIRRQVVAEACILTGLGTTIGIVLSLICAKLIEHFKPLLTVEITLHWIIIGIIAAGLGAIFASAYPAWRAMKIDMSKALSYE